MPSPRCPLLTTHLAQPPALSPQPQPRLPAWFPDPLPSHSSAQATALLPLAAFSDPRPREGVHAAKPPSGPTALPQTDTIHTRTATHIIRTLTATHTPRRSYTHSNTHTNTPHTLYAHAQQHTHTHAAAGSGRHWAESECRGQGGGDTQDSIRAHEERLGGARREGVVGTVGSALGTASWNRWGGGAAPAEKPRPASDLDPPRHLARGAHAAPASAPRTPRESRPCPRPGPSRSQPRARGTRSGTPTATTRRPRHTTEAWRPAATSLRRHPCPLSGGAHGKRVGAAVVRVGPPLRVQGLPRTHVVSIEQGFLRGARTPARRGGRIAEGSREAPSAALAAPLPAPHCPHEGFPPD